MKILDKQTDNVLDVLNMILEFTDRRGKVLHNNIVNVKSNNYRPTDLDATAFADQMAAALSEHLINDRIILVDSENIKFGPNGSFDATSMDDNNAQYLFENDKKMYLKHQMKKIAENQANKKVATMLIERRHTKKSCQV